jgi:HSP20 family molecular chaperone IbpA
VTCIAAETAYGEDAAATSAEPMDLHQITARLDNGMLYITAVRKSREREPAAV